MSRDFELLRKVEQRRKSTAGTPRREVYADFVRQAEIAESRNAVGPSGQAAVRIRLVKSAYSCSKRWRLAASFAAIVVVAAVLILFWIKPEYQPSGRLEIDPPGSETFTMQANGGSPSETPYLETQAQSLQTDDLAIAVIRELGLDKNPDFNAKVPAAAVPADPLQLTARGECCLAHLPHPLESHTRSQQPFDYGQHDCS